MKEKYNIALLPLNHSDKIIKYAEIFSNISDQYFLGKNSLPHLTLCQFRATSDEAEKIWRQVYESLEKKSISLFFIEEISCITFDNQVFWISLLPEPNEELTKLHLQVANIVQHPLNKSYKQYDPHITLVNTQSNEYPQLVNQLKIAYTSFEDIFAIALGKSDEIGQFLEIIHHHHENATTI